MVQTWKESKLNYIWSYIWNLFWFQKFVLMNDLIESCDVLFLNIVEVWTIIYIWLKARRALKFDLVLRDLVTDPERLNSKHYFWTTKILYFYIQYWNQFINRILPINEHIFAETRNTFLVKRMPRNPNRLKIKNGYSRSFFVF